MVGAFAFVRSIAKDFAPPLDPAVIARTRGIQELFFEEAAEFAPDLEPAEQGMRLDAMLTLPGDYLEKVDVASMAFSLEAREPLLDHELMEFAMKLPLAWKLRRGHGKYLLRRLAYRYLPPALVDRPKQGFGIPMDQWLRGPLKAWARERFEDRTLYERVPLVREQVLALYELHLSGARNVHPLLWAILVLLEFTARNAA